MRKLLLSIIIGATALYAQNVGGITQASGGGGGTGTVNSGTLGQMAYYPATAAAVSGNPNVTVSGGVLTIGVAGATIGQVVFSGSTSGTVTLTPQATAGTPTLTLPNTSGTFAVGATSPLVLSPTTGNLTCPTCNTSSSNVSSVFTRTGAVVAASGDYRLDQVSDPTSSISRAWAASTDTSTWNAATGAAVNLFTLTDTASNTGTGYVGTIGTAASSNASPFEILTRGAQSFFVTNSGEFFESSVNPVFVEQFSTDTTGPKLTFRKARGTQGTPSAAASGDQTFFWEGDGYNGAGYTVYQQIFGTVSSGGGTLQVRTANSSGVITQGAILDNSQDWGFAHNVSVGRGAQSGSSAIGLDVFGSSVHELLATPVAPVITNGGTAGSTTYTYAIVAKYFDGTHSPASPTGSTATGNATLTAGNFNTVTWTGVSNAYCYDVYMTVPASHIVSLCNTGTSYNDIGTTVNNNSPVTTNNTGTVQVGGYLKTGVSTNTDLAGKVTLSSGAGTYTFTGVYATAPVCVATDSTATNAVKASTTTTVLTLAGTTTDVINYICVGLN